MQVKNYGLLMVYVTRTGTLRTILFLRVVYVFDFFMNFVSMKKVKSKEVYWDNLNKELVKKQTLL